MSLITSAELPVERFSVAAQQLVPRRVVQDLLVLKRNAGFSLLSELLAHKKHQSQHWSVIDLLQAPAVALSREVQHGQQHPVRRLLAY